MDKQLIDYIQTQQSQGASNEKITADLLANKWEQHVIDEAFTSLRQGKDAVGNPEGMSTAQTTQPQAIGQQTGATHSSNYNVFTAVSEAIGALKLNVVPAVMSLSLSIVFYFFVQSLPVVKDGFRASEITKLLENPARTFTIAVFLFLVYTIVSSFINLMIALSVNDGAEKKKTAVGEVTSRAGKLFPRYLLASLLFVAVVIGPFIAGSALSILLTILLTTIGIGPLGALLSIIISIAAMVWVFIALIRYVLVLYIAIFEPELPLMKMMSRSVFLLQNGGYGFLILGILLFIGINLVLGIIVGIISVGNATAGNVMSQLVQACLSILAQAVFVVFYRNRKAIRG